MMLAAAALLAGCGASGGQTSSARPRLASVPCRLQGSGLMVEPDRRRGCTPGVWIADPDVASAHVCGKGYNPRPGTGVSEPLKHAAERLYGETSSVDSSTEADHLYPLWLGGATVLGNFWPEPNYPRAVGFDHNPKDKLEFAIYRLTCVSRRLSVVQARRIFEGDWRAAYAKYVGRGRP